MISSLSIRPFPTVQEPVQEPVQEQPRVKLTLEVNTPADDEPPLQDAAEKIEDVLEVGTQTEQPPDLASCFTYAAVGVLCGIALTTMALLLTKATKPVPVGCGFVNGA